MHLNYCYSSGLLGVFEGVNGCSSANGGCVHLCLPFPGGRSCACDVNKTRECRPTVLSGPQSLTAFEFDSVVLTCRVDSNGFDVVVEFTTNGSTVHSQSYPSVGHRVVTAAYTISQVDINRVGMYACNAANQYGISVSAEGTLSVTNASRCESSPCLNGGNCSNALGWFNCTCAARYTGPTCSIEITDCDSNPCENAGHCLSLANGGYNCSCSVGFVGVHCERNVDDCVSNPCRNGGSCRRDRSTGFACRCPPGYTGSVCDVDINECASDPCGNDGTCEDGPNGYSCVCITAYTGRNCESRDVIINPGNLLKPSACYCTRLLLPWLPTFGAPFFREIEIGR